VVPAGSSAHGFSCARRLSPLSGRNSTYRLVQISGTGSIGISGADAELLYPVAPNYNYGGQHSGLEIIGNIYEQPHLLTNENE
jgi:hypothetical protein